MAMNGHYRQRKDRTHLSSTFRLAIDRYHYLRVYLWDNLDGLWDNVFPNEDPVWERGKYLACFLGMDCQKDKDGDRLLPKFFGELHFSLTHLGVEKVSHEITHFLMYWLILCDMADLKAVDFDTEAICLLAGRLNKQFWNQFYRRYKNRGEMDWIKLSEKEPPLNVDVLVAWKQRYLGWLYLTTFRRQDPSGQTFYMPGSFEEKNAYWCPLSPPDQEVK